jgi:predicted PurR-regulated permease PerM
VEVIIPARTILLVLVIVGLVALALLSLGTLISIFLAAVPALGLDPIVSALVARGWGRARAALVVFTLMFVAGGSTEARSSRRRRCPGRERHRW